MRTSQQTSEIVKAMKAAQAAFPAIAKDKQVQAGARKYAYAELSTIIDATKPVLLENGLVLTHGMESNGHSALTCRISHVSGEWMESAYPLAAGLNSQEMGSAITYGRRYTLCAMLGIATEDDDDGAAASSAPRKQNSHLSAGPEGAVKPSQASPSPAKRAEQPQVGPAHRGQVVDVYLPKKQNGPHGIKLSYEGIQKSHNTFHQSAIANAITAKDGGLEVEFTFYANDYNGATYMNIKELKVIGPDGVEGGEDENIPF